MPPSPFSRPGVVVPAGGTSRRWGGRDKTAELLDGVPVLAHAVLGAVAGMAPPGQPPPPVAVVAPADHPARSRLAAELGAALRWTREEPAGGGPVAALAAGLAALADEPGRDRADLVGDVVVVVAGDMPFARTAVPRLLAVLATPARAPGPGREPPPWEAAVGIDPGGRTQPLLAAYRAAPLAAALAALPQGGRGQRLRDLVARLAVRTVPVSDLEALDLDVPDRLEEARTRARSLGRAAQGDGA